MLHDVPHARGIIAVGIAGLIAAVVALTWIYPAYCERYDCVREAKVRDFVESQYGITATPLPMLRSSEQARGTMPLPPRASATQSAGRQAARSINPLVPGSSASASSGRDKPLPLMKIN
ncbi:MAG: hypothetical protein GX131_06155 [candidate division WS1 bacterium]|jgi:hypothetical protein|nr:hypothetical protein [candidate division WS1 bacterium]